MDLNSEIRFQGHLQKIKLMKFLNLQNIKKQNGFLLETYQ